MAWFILLEMLSGLNLGYGLTYLNQCASLLYIKNGWTSVNEKTWHISVLGSSMIVGQWLGSGIAGTIMRESRRKALMLSIIVGVVGCFLTLISIKVFWLLNFGRFLYGISSGIGSVVTPRLKRFHSSLPLLNDRYYICLLANGRNLSGAIRRIYPSISK